MNGIKIQKMPEIRHDADTYSKSVAGFHSLLTKHLSDEETKNTYDLKLAVNFTSDSTSMPNLTFVAMHVVNKK